jgi:DNA-directed RNA polymerase specialized sigma24 family protein
VLVSTARGKASTRREAKAAAPMPEGDLELFYRQVFMPLVRRATWKHGLTKEDAADIVQDAFVLALGKLDSSRNPKAWLIQVVDLMALNHQRKARRRAHLSRRWGVGQPDGSRSSSSVGVEAQD